MTNKKAVSQYLLIGIGIVILILVGIAIVTKSSSSINESGGLVNGLIDSMFRR